MRFFNLFKTREKGAETGEKKSKNANEIVRWAERATDRRAQNYDRQEALAALADMDPPAVAALLKRFTFTIDPFILDQEEKEIAFKGVLNAGREAIEPVRTFAQKAESLAWPIKILKAILSEEELIEELTQWLSQWDTEYAKFVDPKVQLLATLEEYQSARIQEIVTPFLEDVNESARFHAVNTLLAQGDEKTAPCLLKALCSEESFRVKNKIAEGFGLYQWQIPEEQHKQVKQALPHGFSVDQERRIRKETRGANQ